MLTVRVLCPAELTPQCDQLLRATPSLSGLVRIPQASVDPSGDLFEAQVERDAVNDLVAALMDLDIQKNGSIEIIEPDTWISARALHAEQTSPDTDNVIWPQVIERAYSQTKITGTFLAFMTMATLLAAIAVITDSPILVIGAMALGPEFMAVIALGLALVRGRDRRCGRGAGTHDGPVHGHHRGIHFGDHHPCIWERCRGAGLRPVGSGER